MQMTNSLNPTARQLHVPKRPFINDPEVLAAFRREIDVAVGAERRGGYPEDLLREDPGDEILGDCFVEGAHCVDR